MKRNSLRRRRRRKICENLRENKREILTWVEKVPARSTSDNGNLHMPLKRLLPFRSPNNEAWFPPPERAGGAPLSIPQSNFLAFFKSVFLLERKKYRPSKWMALKWFENRCTDNSNALMHPSAMEDQTWSTSLNSSGAFSDSLLSSNLAFLAEGSSSSDCFSFSFVALLDGSENENNYN